MNSVRMYLYSLARLEQHWKSEILYHTTLLFDHLFIKSVSLHLKKTLNLDRQKERRVSDRVLKRRPHVKHLEVAAFNNGMKEKENN